MFYLNRLITRILALHGAARRRRPPPAFAALALALATGAVLLGPTPDAEATPGRFDAGTNFALSTTALGAPADVTATMSIPVGDNAYAEVSTHFPPQSDLHDQISPGNAPAIGDVVGTIQTSETLGITGLNCTSNIAIDWVLINAVPNASNGLVNADSDPPPVSALPVTGRVYPFISDDGMGSDGTPGPQTTPGNGLAAGVEEYPAFLESLFNVAGFPVYPDARYFAGNIVAHHAWTLNLMVFGPGDLAGFAPPNPLWDVSTNQFGYASILVVDDPTQAAAPFGITDNCTATASETVFFGQARANGCLPAGACPAGTAIFAPCSVAPDVSPPIGPQCNTLSAVGTRYENPGTAESGTCVTSCTRMFLGVHMSARDLDGDGYDNSFDTCPTVFTDQSIFDARTGGNDLDDDPDADAIPGGGPAGGCDPTPGAYVPNQDGDLWPVNGDGWSNALDNCPLVVNGFQTETELAFDDKVARPEGGPKFDGMGVECDGSEDYAPACPSNAEPDCGTPTACTNGKDDDLDTLINDGCPPAGLFTEVGCLNSIDDPDEDDTTLGAQQDDLLINDGCPSSAFVANGDYWVTMSKTPVCFTNSPLSHDTDVDGWCDTTTPSDVGGYPYTSPADPNDGDAAITPEAYTGTFFPMPIAASGASGSPTPARQPIQECNDGLDNDGDTLVDLLDAASGACRPPNTLILRPADSDGDGYSDEAEIHVGTDVFGRCDVGGSPAISRDWPADINDGGGTSRDEIDTADIAVFVGGLRPLGKNPGQPGFDRRLDVVPGPGALSTWINTLDLAQINVFIPPMFGVKAFNYLGTDCTPHPKYSD